MLATHRAPRTVGRMDIRADIQEVNGEVRQWAEGLDVSWRDFATMLKGKIIEAGMAGGVTSWTFGGRTVSSSTEALTALHKYALAQLGGGAPVRQLGRFCS